MSASHTFACLPRKFLEARSVLLQLWKGFRQHHYASHRRLGYLALAATALGSLSAAPYALSYLVSAQVPETVSPKLLRFLHRDVTWGSASHALTLQQPCSSIRCTHARQSHPNLSDKSQMWIGLTKKAVYCLCASYSRLLCLERVSLPFGIYAMCAAVG